MIYSSNGLSLMQRSAVGIKQPTIRFAAHETEAQTSPVVDTGNPKPSNLVKRFVATAGLVMGALSTSHLGQIAKDLQRQNFLNACEPAVEEHYKSLKEEGVPLINHDYLRECKNVKAEIGREQMERRYKKWGFPND